MSVPGWGKGVPVALCQGQGRVKEDLQMKILYDRRVTCLWVLWDMQIARSHSFLNLTRGKVNVKSNELN